MKIDILSKGRNIPNLLHPVVVDLIGFGAAAGARMPTPRKFDLNMFFFIIPYLFNDYIFQSQQF